MIILGIYFYKKAILSGSGTRQFKARNYKLKRCLNIGLIILYYFVLIAILEY